jgi:NADH-quinone oxidoreductase subunit I
MNLLVHKAKELWSLLTGLAITGKYFCSPRLTTRYPRQVVAPEATASYRGPIELVGLDNAPEIPRCISCLLCVSACPSNCISVAKSQPPKPTAEEAKAMAEAEARGEKPKKIPAPKNPAAYTYDFTLCSLCACCVEACPVGSIRFSNELYVVGERREDFHYDLLSRLRRQAAKHPRSAAKEASA